MKTKNIWLAVLAFAAALTSAQTIRAISFGEPDGNMHPSVGGITRDAVWGEHLVGGTGFLVYKGWDHNGNGVGVFLTAGHVTELFEAENAAGLATNTAVNFDPDPMSHRDKDVQVGEIITLLIKRPNFSDWTDLGILILHVDDPADLPEPAVLAPVGFLEQFTQRQLQDSLFLTVGYGATLLFPPSEIVFESKRQVAAPKYLNVQNRAVLLQANGPAGNSGSALGDSGGPLFLKDAETGQESVVAIFRGPENQNWNSVDIFYRADLQEVHDFIQAVIDQL